MRNVTKIEDTALDNILIGNCEPLNYHKQQIAGTKNKNTVRRRGLKAKSDSRIMISR